MDYTSTDPQLTYLTIRYDPISSKSFLCSLLTVPAIAPSYKQIVNGQQARRTDIDF